LVDGGRHFALITDEDFVRNEFELLVGVSHIDSRLDRARKHPDIAIGTTISTDEGAESAAHAIHSFHVVNTEFVDFSRER
jgi:hypothetical protein